MKNPIFEKMSQPDEKTTESLRSKALDWFFDLDEMLKILLKDKHLEDEFVEYSSRWGYHYTFGQIEKMYLAEHPENNLNTVTQEEYVKQENPEY